MDTIKSSRQISSLFANGKRLHTPYITLIFDTRGSDTAIDDGHDQCGRVAFIAGKKQGKAVWRNRAKRRMRAICADLGGPWHNLDVIFLAKPSVTDETYSKVLMACKKAMQKSFFKIRG
ncbi:MAG: ribonuclease P protein component [Eggerthellaceae bacterium]|nr:ribonuclease P protein component [Eggerthellaceae bacterium]